MSKPCDNFYLPVNDPRFPQMVQPGDIVFVGQYLFTGSETTSVYMEVLSTSGVEVVCRCNNDAQLSGELLILQIVGKEVRLRLPRPTVSEAVGALRCWWSLDNTPCGISVCELIHGARFAWCIRSGCCCCTLRALSPATMRWLAGLAPRRTHNPAH